MSIRAVGRMAELRAQQLAMARYLRDPAKHPAPKGVDARRLKVYETLIYNNIEGFISSGFPVLRRLYTDSAWHRLVREFINVHRCHTPYFLEISQEFVRFLLERTDSPVAEPAFIAELAHYEWVELALTVAEEEVPADAGGDPMESTIALSPLAWVLSYRFPVHRIGEDFRPEAAGEPVYLVVYRNRQDAVRFVSLNAATARLLEMIRDSGSMQGAEVLQALAAELSLPVTTVASFGSAQLTDFVARGIVVTCEPALSHVAPASSPA